MSALSRMRRDIRDHQRQAPRAALRGAWVAHQRHVRARTGATRFSANAGVGMPVVRQVRRGPQYPARGPAESDRKTRAFRLGQKLYITTGHPGGLLARGIRYRKVGGVEGFFKAVGKDAEAAFRFWKYRRRAA